MDRRVVVTAASAITPIGRTKAEIVDNLLRGVSGVAKLREPGFLTQHIHSKVYGTVGYPIEYDFERRFRKTMAPVSFYACQVAKEALAASGLGQEYLSSGRVGIAFGSIHGSPTVQQDIYRTVFEKMVTGEAGPYSISGADYLKSMVHTTAVSIAKMFAITGRIISSCTACTTASQSIGYGYESIRFGMQDAMLCGAADEYDTTTVAVFDNLLACSTDFNATPNKTPRPFDLRRDGLVIGEGAGILLLEEYESAKKRGAEILGEVIGFSCGNNGGDIVLPDVNGVRRTIEGALESARIGPGDVDFVSAHATATRQGDAVEAEALGAVYGKGPRITGFKGNVGHTMSACGAIESIFTLYLMERGVVVPTLNLEEVDPKCDMIRHPRKVEEVNVKIAAVQNFAFGGVNTCLFFKSTREMRRAGRFVLDVTRTALLWVYFTHVYFLFFVPLYPLAWIVPGRPERFIQRLNHVFLRGFFAFCRLIMPRLSIRVADDVRAIGSSVVVCNHVSYLDPLVLVSVFAQHKTIMKSAFFRVPLFGFVMRVSGYVSFDPGDRGPIDTMGELAQFLRAGGNLFVFPEGRRSKDGRIGAFSKGAFDIAKRAGAPVEALFVRNTGTLYPCDRFRFDTCSPIAITLERLATVSADEWAAGASAEQVTARTQALYEQRVEAGGGD